MTAAFINATGKEPQWYEYREKTAANASLSSQWKSMPKWLAQLSVAKTTRFSTVVNYSRVNDSTGNFDPDSFDPNLKVEDSRDLNFILRHDFSQARLTGSIFYQNVDDFIFSFEHTNNAGAKLTAFKNIDLLNLHLLP